MSTATATLRSSLRTARATLAGAVATLLLLGPAAGPAAAREPAARVAASASSEYSVGSPEQVSWVRRAAGNFVAAELAGNGAAACSVLNAPLRATRHRVTCEQRLNARLARMRHDRAQRSRLRVEQRAIASARVVVRGDRASIELPLPLLAGRNRFLWTENCWMLEG
jgi:hypothetical protein